MKSISIYGSRKRAEPAKKRRAVKTVRTVVGRAWHKSGKIGPYISGCFNGKDSLRLMVEVFNRSGVLNFYILPNTLGRGESPLLVFVPHSETVESE